MKGETCIQCAQKMSCTPEGPCWCFTLPALLSPDSNSQCLCPDCLIKKLSHLVNKDPNLLTKAQKQKIADLEPVMQPKKDVDYYMENIDGQRMLVFTSWYLLRRGYCCDNNCRNCPYPKQFI